MVGILKTLPLTAGCILILSAFSLIWILALLSSRPLKFQNILLAQSFLFTVIVSVLHTWAIVAPNIPLMILLPCLKFLLIPLLFIYLRILLPPQLQWNSKLLFHFVPGLAVMIILCSLYFLTSWSLNEWIELTRAVFRPIGLIQGAFYISLSFFLIQKSKETLSKDTAHWEIVQMKWAWLFLIQYAALWFSNVFELFLTNTIYPKLTWDLVAVLGQGVLTIYALKYSFTLSLQSQPQDDADTKQSKIRLDENELKTESEKLLSKLQESKAYLQPNYALKDLATLLNKPAYQVSEIINRGLHQSFFDLINSLRIEEAMKVFKCKENSKKTIIEIAYEVGYNSKSAFNSSFKKFSGTTPSLYRDQAR